MILFVLEGTRPDKSICKAIMSLLGKTEESLIVAYGYNIYELYGELIDLGEGADLVDLLMDKYSNDSSKAPDNWVSKTEQISEKYLFFDYDFHDVNRNPEVFNNQLRYMLDYFNEETEHGKLYINYPMVESIRYTKELPDTDFFKYTVSREECRSFKHLVNDFSFYPNNDFITRGDASALKDTWTRLKIQNVAKANYICNGNKVFPPQRAESISQNIILDKQILKYESCPDCRVAVLSSFPILLYDWLGY